MPRRLLTALAAAGLVALSAAPAQAATKPKPKQVLAVFQGSIKSVSPAAGRVTLTITGANVYGRKLLKKSWSFDVRKAVIRIGDANGDGKANLADAKPGHLASVTAKVPETGPFARRLKATRFVDLSALVVLPTAPPVVPTDPGTAPQG